MCDPPKLELVGADPFELQGTDALKEVAAVLPERDILFVMVIHPSGKFDYRIRGRPGSPVSIGNLLGCLETAKVRISEDYRL